MSIESFTEDVNRTWQHKRPELTPHQTNLVEAAMGLAGEAGEVAEIIKKHVFRGKPLDIDALVDELGDAMYYLIRTADECGISGQRIMANNIRKRNRRHPKGYNSGHYTGGDNGQE